MAVHAHVLANQVPAWTTLPLHVHALANQVLACGCDDGTVHMFDYSAAAAVRMKTRDQGSGGFSDAQKQALAAAVESARRRAAENAFAERYGGGADS